MVKTLRTLTIPAQGHLMGFCDARHSQALREKEERHGQISVVCAAATSLPQTQELTERAEARALVIPQLSGVSFPLTLREMREGVAGLQDLRTAGRGWSEACDRNRAWHPVSQGGTTQRISPPYVGR